MLCQLVICFALNIKINEVANAPKEYKKCNNITAFSLKVENLYSKISIIAILDPVPLIIAPNPNKKLLC